MDAGSLKRKAPSPSAPPLTPPVQAQIPYGGYPTMKSIYEKTNGMILFDIYGDTSLVLSGTYHDDVNIKTYNYIPTDYTLGFLGTQFAPTRIVLSGPDWHEEDIRLFYLKIQGKQFISVQVDARNLMSFYNLRNEIKIRDPYTFEKLELLLNMCT